jgi:hypothetical protein
VNLRNTESGNITQTQEQNFSGHKSFLTHPPFLLLISGLILILFYFIMARDLNFFLPRDFTYAGGPRGLVPISDDLDLSYIRHFSPWFLDSFFWKVFLLTPAAVLISLAFTFGIAPERIDKIINRIRSFHPAFLLSILSLSALIVILILIGFVYNKTYITDDENAYVFQAKIIEKGKILAPPPPVEKSFDNWFIITQNVFTGKYTLGFPFLLALGLRFAGSCYFFSVLLAVFTITLFFLVGKEFYDSQTGLLASVILACSPFFLFNAANLLSHASNLFSLSVFTWMYLRGLRRNSWFLGLVAGLAFGAAFNIRQLTALGFGCPFALYLLWRIKNDKGKILPFASGLVIGAIPIFLVTFWYNRVISGSYFRFPFHVYDPSERLGFGAMLDNLRYTHTPVKGIQNLLVSLGRLNLWFLGMPISLVFILPVFFNGLREKGDRWCLAIILCFFIFYLFYYSPGVPDTGPVYYFELLLPLSLLCARGLSILYNNIWFRNSSCDCRRFFPLFFSFSLFLGVISFLPEHALHFIAMTGKIKEPYDLVEKRVEMPAMVFVRSLPLVGWVFGYKSADPWLKAPLLFCRDLGPEKNWDVIQCFPDRNYYILYFDATKNENFIQPFSKEDIRKYLQSTP